MTTNFFSPLSFVAVFGTGNRDPRSGIRDKHPGSATLSATLAERLGSAFSIVLLEEKDLNDA
jgi:hypothetical protein